MFRMVTFALAALSVCLLTSQTLDGRGFGGFHAGGGGGGGYRGGGYSGSFNRGFSSFSSTDRFGGSYSGTRSGDTWSGLGRGYSGSYDRSWTDARGGSINTSGSRSAYEGRYGGAAVAGNRDTTVTTAGGKTYSAERQGAAVSGPGGRTVGGASGTVDGPRGTNSWQSAFAGNRSTGNFDHYASVYGANGVHSTAYWSSGYMGTHAGYIRTGFGYYNCFHPAWYAAHPGCWFAAGWAAGAAWATPTYAVISDYCGLPPAAADYDYGTTVVYQGDDVYIDGQNAWTADQYAQQAVDIASQGQTASAPPTEEWKAVGVYALVQGDEKTSNNIFQLAVNKDGIIRGNYYDGVANTNTEVYGSVNKKAMLAAWTIGKNKDRVFEAGVYNLTQPECPCLLHLGTQSTQQLLLVRMEQPKKDS